jgi:hypothetical protein
MEVLIDLNQMRGLRGGEGSLNLVTPVDLCVKYGARNQLNGVLGELVDREEGGAACTQPQVYIMNVGCCAQAKRR